MRRAFLVALVLALSLVLVPTATAHNTCTVRAWHPTETSPMWYSGEFACDPELVHSITLSVSLERKQPGGLWVQVSSHTDTDNPAWRNYTAVVTSINYDCRKYYRTRANGSASPGGHSGTITRTLLPTC